jgi:hypothetical protein
MGTSETIGDASFSDAFPSTVGLLLCDSPDGLGHEPQHDQESLRLAKGLQVAGMRALSTARASLEMRMPPGIFNAAGSAFGESRQWLGR